MCDTIDEMYAGVSEPEDEFQMAIVEYCDQQQSKYASKMYEKVTKQDLKDAHDEMTTKNAVKSLKAYDALLSFIYNAITISVVPSDSEED